MKTLGVLALALVLAASSVQAGGPVVVVEDPEPTVEGKPPSSGGILPWLMVPLVICIFMCGSEEEQPTPP